MLRKKQKKHSLSDYLRYMRLIEDGYSFHYICDHYGSNSKMLKVLWHRYQEFGIEGLKKRRYFQSTFEIKKKIVLDIEKNYLTLHAASIKYGPCPDTISDWRKIYRAEGLSGLECKKKRGRPPGMGRPRKNSRPLTELERLRKEVQELKTENALLKKVRALVEERNAREEMEDNGQKLIIRMNNAWSGVETSHKKLLIAHDAISQAEENLRLHRDYYRVGTTSMTDLLLAEEQYQQACDRYTEAYATLQTKQLEYRKATGQ